MSIIRQARNLQKMIDEVMNHIVERWKFNSRIFKDLSLHTLKAIKKCVRVEYFMKEILQRLKLTMMYRLRNSKRDISRAILSNVTNWARVIDDLFDTERVTIQKLRELDLLHKESFSQNENSNSRSRISILRRQTWSSQLWLMRWSRKLC